MWERYQCSSFQKATLNASSTQRCVTLKHEHFQVGFFQTLPLKRSTLWSIRDPKLNSVSVLEYDSAPGKSVCGNVIKQTFYQETTC